MKKIFALGMALMLVMGLAVPAMAIDTNYGITNSVTESPVMLAGWMLGDIGNGDDCDVCPCTSNCGPGGTLLHQTFGTQVTVRTDAPNPGAIDDTNSGVTVCFYTIVLNPGDYGQVDISGVYADLFHPNAAKWPNMVPVDDNGIPSPNPPAGVPVDGEWCCSFKDQVDLALYDNDANPDNWSVADITGAQALLSEGETKNLVWYNPDAAWDDYDSESEILDKLANGARLYWGCYWIENHQPCGTYNVQFLAQDLAGPVGNLDTKLEVCCEESLAYDNTGITFPQRRICEWSFAQGDTTFDEGDGEMTVWNNGNVYANVMVELDNMGILDDYAGRNIHFGARLGNQIEGVIIGDGNANDVMEDGCPSVDPGFGPDEQIRLPETLVMCTPQKLDLWVKIDKCLESWFIGSDPPRSCSDLAGDLTLTAKTVPFFDCESVPSQMPPWVCTTDGGPGPDFDDSCPFPSYF